MQNLYWTIMLRFYLRIEQRCIVYWFDCHKYWKMKMQTQLLGDSLVKLNPVWFCVIHKNLLQSMLRICLINWNSMYQFWTVQSMSKQACLVLKRIRLNQIILAKTCFWSNVKLFHLKSAFQELWKRVCNRDLSMIFLVVLFYSIIWETDASLSSVGNKLLLIHWLISIARCTRHSHHFLEPSRSYWTTKWSDRIMWWDNNM